MSGGLRSQVLSTPQLLYQCFDALLADPQYGALVVPHTFAYEAATERIRVLDEAATRHGKVACATWLTQHLEDVHERHPGATAYISQDL